MKIVHIIGFYQPEFGYQEYYLSKRQKENGHDVYLLTSDYLYPFKDIGRMLKDIGSTETGRKRKPGSYDIDGVKVFRFKSFFRYGDFILARGIKKKLGEIRPDIVYAHEAKQGLPLFAAKYKKTFGYKLIYNHHDFYHTIRNHALWKKLLRYVDYFWFRIFLVRWALSKADAIISPVDEITSFLINRHHIEPSKIKSFPLGVETQLFMRSGKDRNALRKKYSIAEDETVLLFSGRIESRKNIELLIETFSQLRKQFPLKLFIIGSGDKAYFEKLNQMVLQKGLKKDIFFTGFTKKADLTKFFSAADIAVWPGNNSISIMEAMSCSLPIVIVDLQLGYLASHNNGFTFKDGDAEGFAEIIKKIIIDKNLRKRMSENSRKAAIENYSEQKRSHDITQFCCDLVQNNVLH
ncbi:MAG: glycosyltransferase family 4 protein [Patescibacteria group bacterium]